MIKKIKNKEGITTIFICLLMTFLIAILIYLIDGGRAFIYKTELQQIADSMSLGGVYSGIKNNSENNYINNYEGAKANVIINESLAVSTANKLLKCNINKKDNNQLFGYSTNYNFKGKCSNKTKEILYSSGIFNVTLTSKVKKLFGTGDMIIKVDSTSRVNVENTNKVNMNDTKIEFNTNENVIVVKDGSGRVILRTAIK